MDDIIEQLGYLKREVPAHLTIYTDGACKGNPGPGGWGVHLQELNWGLCGGSLHTTNNIMEMTAMLKALQLVDMTGSSADIYLDSNLVLKGLTEWLPGWKASNYKTVKKNLELWQQIIPLYDKLASKLNLYKVKGHSNDPGNDAADALANKGVQECLTKSKTV